MGKYKLTSTQPPNPYLEFRKIRGQLFGTKDGKKVVTANGRGDRVDWIELKRKEIKDQAIENRGRVIAAVDAHIQVLCEIEDRPSVLQFDVMVTSALAVIARDAGLERRGHYSTLRQSWENEGRYAASDHHAVWLDLAV